VQDTVVVPVFCKNTVTPAGRATDAEEAVAVSVAKVPPGVNPDKDAENVPLTGNGLLFETGAAGLPKTIVTGVAEAE
jgi:hypothetical protein